jgi:uncharacterized repeat protein (TIGR04076 family)
MLEITIHEIRGKCPVHNLGDRIIVAQPEILLKETDALCIHALPTILHYALILEYDWCPLKLGLTKESDPEHAYIHCLDPGEPYTDGGTVIFRIKKIDNHN